MDAIIDPRLVDQAHLSNPAEYSLIERPISSWQELAAQTRAINHA